MFFVKIHKKLGREVVAVCDKDILGKTFDNGKIHFEVSEGFYKGEEKSKEELKIILLDAKNTNLCGKETIKLALDLKVIDKENIIEIKGMHHAQSIFL